MKPNKIILIRHGESAGNVDKSIYSNVPDYALTLTENGIQQADAAGKELVQLVGGPKTRVQFYVSPFWRTRQTYYNIAKYFDPTAIQYYEDPRIREQEWCGALRKEGYSQDMEDERDSYGHFYFRFQGGESCADVFDRSSDFTGTMFRDFQKPNFPGVAAIVSHGMTIRVLLMRFFHASVEEFETWSNPRNCEYFVLEKQPDDKYILTTPLRRHVIKHNYQFPYTSENSKYFSYPTFKYDNQSGQGSHKP